MQTKKTPIYVCHVADFTDRKLFMEEQFERLQLRKHFASITYVTKYPIADLQQDPNINKRLAGNPYDWYSRCNVAGYGEVTYRPLRITELSLALKHLWCYNLASQGVADYALILEDDAVLSDNFVEVVEQLITRGKAEDMAACFMGNSAHTAQLIFGDGLIKGVGRPQSRCTDSYLISNECCIQLLDTIQSPVLPIDFDMSYALAKNLCQVWHLQKPIVSQASQNGKFERSI